MFAFAPDAYLISTKDEGPRPRTNRPQTMDTGPRTTHHGLRNNDASSKKPELWDAPSILLKKWPFLLSIILKPIKITQLGLLFRAEVHPPHSNNLNQFGFVWVCSCFLRTSAHQCPAPAMSESVGWRVSIHSPQKMTVSYLHHIETNQDNPIGFAFLRRGPSCSFP